MILPPWWRGGSPREPLSEALSRARWLLATYWLLLVSGYVVLLGVAFRYWGADQEFLVLLPGADEGSGVVLAERLRSALEQSRLRFGDQTIPLTATFGVSQAGQQDAWDAVIQRADEALYVGKKERGRNCVVPASSLSRRAVAA